MKSWAGSSLRFFLFLFALIGAALSNARATVAVSPIYGNNMVIQRDQPFPVRGTAGANKTITVTYNGQTNSVTSDAQGNWQLSLPAMGVKTNGSNFAITEAGGNTITLVNVVVGDVWLFSGQSNMGIDMNFCNQQADISSANFPGIRCFGFVPYAPSGTPSKTFNGSVNWSVCSPSTVGGYSAVAFYFGRSIYTNQNRTIPLGLVVSCVGGTTIDLWLDPEGITGIPALAPLYSQSNPANGAFSLFNGMIYPLAPYPVKGLIWYQGENAELTTQSADSYYLKEKGLIAGWKQLLGLSDCAFYLVQIASWGTAPTSPAPVLNSGGWNADTRLQQGNALNLPHAGVASAIDIGDSSTGADIWYGWHPTNKWDVGYRLSLWALKNEYNQPDIVPSGPVLRDVSVAGNTATCTFDYAGAGLMAGFKPMYGPTQPTNAALALFSIAGVDGTWYWATATIVGSNTVQLTSPSVSAPRKVAYACWQNPVGANLYNSNGLPALPFYVDDVTAKYTVTASAGPGGSISPAGAATYFKRMTALYKITPGPGQYIRDVQVDGASVGSVDAYTFDPLYANHTITATFTNARPSYTVNASAAAGGSINPSGAVSVAQGGSQQFFITPNPGCLYSLAADGKPMGSRDSFIFSDVTSDHSIAASFYCTINASAGFGGSISAPGVTTVGYGSNMTYTITPASNYSILKVTVDGTNVGAVASYTFTNVTTAHTISASFTGGSGGGSVPQTNHLLFSCLADAMLTNSAGTITSWPTYVPAAAPLSPMGNPSPKLTRIDGRPFARNDYGSAPAGFNQGAYSSPLPCSGASIVVVAKPTRNGIAGGWGSVVDAFYNQLSLGILNDSGKVFVLLNGAGNTSSTAIPDGQTTILSMVVQPSGQYNVWANGSLVLTSSASNPLTSLVNGVAGPFANNITLGNNYPDGWSTFNGCIGDVFFYTNALSSTDRASLEQYLATRLTSGSGTNYTITASAGAGGAISPAGSVLVSSGSNQSFTIATDTNHVVSDVLVDGISVGAVSSYTFTNVIANHTIAATFAYNGYTITATAGSGGGISPSGAVPVPSGANQSFTITPLPGGSVSNVLVDGESQGAITHYTFTNVLADHTISATFSYTSYTISATAGTGGSITPTGAVSVGSGTSQTFTIAADAGYAIADVVVDSISRGAISEFTFTNVTANHSISATFNALPNQGGIISVNYCQQNDILSAAAVAGVVPTNHWNSIIFDNNFGGTSCSNPTNVFFDCSGASIGNFAVKLSVNGFNAWNTGSGSTPDVVLISDWAMSGGGTITLTNIPYANYDLYFYLSSFAEYPSGTVTYNITTGPDTGRSLSLQQVYDQTKPQNFASFGWVEGYNWGKFSALTASSQTIVGTDGISAFQIVQNVLPAPTLSIKPTGSGGIEITWPDSYSGTLLTSPVLGVGAVWTPVAGDPVHEGSVYKVTVTPTENNAFYGLGQ
ncbi:MAG TPA: sialate O-acetylesterase [Verrucomicrobiae bacterium]|nr:sialate O-acetylesterase [Verrucomicrobiae bacterium]